MVLEPATKIFTADHDFNDPNQRDLISSYLRNPPT